MATLTTDSVATETGIPGTTLSRWARDGLCEPEGGRRQRVPWRWDEESYRQATIIDGLRKARLPWELVEDAMVYLRALGASRLASAAAVIVRGRDGPVKELVELLDGRALLNVAGRLGPGCVLVILPESPKSPTN